MVGLFGGKIACPDEFDAFVSRVAGVLEEVFEAKPKILAVLLNFPVVLMVDLILEDVAMVEAAVVVNVVVLVVVVEVV